jgi:hypothetical protein
MHERLCKIKTKAGFEADSMLRPTHSWLQCSGMEPLYEHVYRVKSIHISPLNYFPHSGIHHSTNCRSIHPQQAAFISEGKQPPHYFHPNRIQKPSSRAADSSPSEFPGLHCLVHRFAWGILSFLWSPTAGYASSTYSASW